MKQMKKMVLLVVMIVLTGLGASLSLKAAVGLGAWDALAQSLSYLFIIKVGTLGMVLNISCVFGQWLLLRKEFKIQHLLQLPLSILAGLVINFFFYTVLEPIVIQNYFIKSLLLILGFIICAFTIGTMMALNTVTFALEGFCMAVSKKTRGKFALIRQWADILSILLVFLLTFVFSLPMTLREGTVLGMLIFAPLMGFFMTSIQPVLKRFDLI